MEQSGSKDLNIRTDEDHAGTNVITKLHSVPIVCSTPAGAAWARKHDHPPAPTPADYCGIPDINNSPSFRTEYRAVKDFQTYKTYPTGKIGEETINFNKVLFLQWPSVTASLLAYKYPTSGGLATQLEEDVMYNPSISVPEQIRTCGSGRLAYKSATYSLNASDFNNQGTVTVGSFRGNVSYYPVADFVELVRRLNPSGLDAIVKLISARSPIRNDGDFEVISRTPPLRDSPSGSSIMVINLGRIPVTGTDVLQVSPNATVNPAREGAFVVQRFSQPIAEYKSYSLGTVMKPSTSAVAQGCLVFTQTQDDTLTDQDFVKFRPIHGTNYSTPTLPLGHQDLAMFDLTFSWVMFEGLSVQPAGSQATTVTPPYITVKSITGYEAQAYPNSALATFMTNSAVVDTKALEFAAMLAHTRQDSLPARFNFWGALGSAVLAAAPAIITTLKDVFTDQRPKVTQKRTTLPIAKKVIAIAAAVRKPATNTRVRQRILPPATRSILPRTRRPLASIRRAPTPRIAIPRGTGVPMSERFRR